LFRTFQFRLLPNATQRTALQRILADNCETYNAALQERREAWMLQRKFITYRDQQDEVTELRKDPAYQWMASDIQRDPLRRVDRAFKAFFRRCKTREKPGFPRYRSTNRYHSFEFSPDSRRPSPVRARSVHITGVGNVRYRGSRQASGLVKVCTIKRDGTRWAATITCDIGPAPEKCAVSSPVGIDVGLTALATLSDGTEIENPRWTKRHEDRIAVANRALARKKRGSKNRIKAREVLRRAHQSAANARLNHIHHVSKWLISKYDLIAHEDLKVANMVRSNLAKSIMDAAWGILLFQLKYKAESAGTWVVPVNPRGTSQRCSGCGVVVPKTLRERAHVCPECGLSLGRDHNAALNILALGTSAVAVRAESHLIPAMG
jgi:putative transposase